MTLLPVLMLAGGLNSAIAIASPTPPAPLQVQSAQVVLNRSVAAAESRLHRRAITRALSASGHDFSQALAREIAATRITPQSVATSTRNRAAATLDRMVEAARLRLADRAVDNAMRESTHDFGHMLALEIAASGPAREVAREAVNRDGKAMPLTSRCRYPQGERHVNVYFTANQPITRLMPVPTRRPPKNGASAPMLCSTNSTIVLNGSLCGRAVMRAALPSASISTLSRCMPAFDHTRTMRRLSSGLAECVNRICSRGNGH